MAPRKMHAVSIEKITPTVYLRGPEHAREQAVDLTLRNAGSPCEVAFSVKSASGTLELPPAAVPEGESVRRVCIPAVKAKRRITFSVKGGKSKSLMLEPQRKWTVYLVQNAHFDPGYTNLPSHVMRNYGFFFDDVIRYCEESDDWPEETRFRYQIEQSWMILHAMRNRPPATVAKLVELMREGRLEVNALYANMITGLCSSEEIARLLYPSFYLKRQYGISIRTAEHNDVPGISWGIAAALADVGVRYFIPGLPDYFSWRGPYRNFWADDVIRPKGIPTAFHWEAPCGDRVLFFNHDQGAGGEFDPELKEIDGYLRSLEAKGYPYTCHRCFTNGAFSDNAPPSFAFALRARAHNAQWAYPQFIVATNSMFCEHLEREIGDEVQTFRGDLPGTDYPIGATSMARETGLNRLTHERLAAAERYATIACAISKTEYPGYLFGETWEDVQRYDEHAFGLAYPLGAGQDACRAEKSVYAHRAAAVSEDLLAKMTNRIADQIRIDAEGIHVVVFNPLAHPRSEAVQFPAHPIKTCDRAVSVRHLFTADGDLLPMHASSILNRSLVIPPPELFEEGFEVIDVDSGEIVPHQCVPIEEPFAAVPYAAERLSHGQRRYLERFDLQFFARDVPALGYRTYRLIPKKSKAKAPDDLKVTRTTLDSPFYRLEVDSKSGAVTSIYDKELKREIVDRKASYGVNQVVTRDFATTQIEAATKSRVRSGRKGPVSMSLVVTGSAPGCPQRTQEIILYRDVKRIDFATRLLKDPDYTREIFFAFPFAVEKPRFHYEAGLSVIEPIEDQLPGTNTDAASIQHYASVANQKWGVTWTSREAPIALFSEIWPGYVSPAHHNLTPPNFVHDFLSDPSQFEHGHIYSLVLSNNYETNFYTSQCGDMLFRYSITSHAGPWNSDRAKGFGWNVSNPLDAVYLARNPSGSLPPTHGFLELDSEHVELIGLKQAEDGNGIIVRLLETAGKGGTIRLKQNLGKTVAARSTNLAEEDSGLLKSTFDVVEVPVRPWAPSTVRLILAERAPEWKERPW